jgi:hypothetical protein
MPGSKHNIETKAEAQQLTRELLADRLDRALYAALDAGHVFSDAENRALRTVTRWPDERLRKAIAFYESLVKR